MIFRRRMRTVVVLGAGPAGLLAAHAASKQGYEVYVLTAPGPSGQPRKSQLYGCQYLHAAIPGITEGDGTPVSYVLDGSPEDYRYKVYGGGWQGRVSPDEFGPEEPHLAWDLRAAYDALWQSWLPLIKPALLNASNVEQLFVDRSCIVLSTIPANVICRNPQHAFDTQMVWAMGSAPGNALPYVASPNTVWCNAHEAPRWYRAATVFGHSTLEWPQGVKPPVAGVVRVEKPLKTDCDCRTSSGRWHRLGRYGKWQKGVLVHTAYSDALEVLR